jgi:hypothetical protein
VSWYKIEDQIAVQKKQRQEEIVDLPHLNLRLAIGVDLSSVEEVATYVTISLPDSVNALGGRYHGQRPFECTP